MRVQLESQTLRLRIDEAELAQMLAGGMAENRTRLPDGRQETQQLRLAGQLGWQRDDAHWRIALPDADVRALSARLPSREGLHFGLATPEGGTLEILFDVDVRDSARKRLSKSSKGEAS
jgi:hypothetical protein